MKRLILAILFLICLSFQASAFSPVMVFSGTSTVALSTPVYIAANRTTGDVGWSTTNTVSFTPQSGTNRIFILYSLWNQTANSSGATFDGNAMAQIGTDQDSGAMGSAMYWYATDSGTSAINVVQTISTSASIGSWIIQIDGANTTSPIKVTSQGTADGIDPLKISVTVDTTGNDNCLLIGGAGVLDSSSVSSVCDTTGQTLFADFSFQAVMTAHGGYYDHSTAGSKAQCYQSDIAFSRIVLIVTSIKPNGS